MSKIDELVEELCPDGVAYTALGDVCQYSTSRIDSSTLDETTFVGVDNLVANKGGRVDATHSANSTNVTAFQPGDVLLGNIRPYLKKVWLADRSGGCSGDVLAFSIKSDWTGRITPEFLYYQLSSDAFFAFNMSHAKGAKMPRGDKKALLTYEFQIPPLPIQHAIVDILDKFTELEAELEAELAARKKQYEYYRDALLTFEEDGGAEVDFTQLSEIATFSYGLTAKAQSTGDYRFIRITDITPTGKLQPNDSKFVAKNLESDKYILNYGDLLMARTGATYGKTLHYTDAEPATFASFLIKIEVQQDVLEPSYYWHFAQSKHYWSQVNCMVATGGQPQFNANLLRKVVVPVPALERQRQLVDVLDAFDSLTTDLSFGLPAELEARRKQYEYYRDRLLTFKEKVA